MLNWEDPLKDYNLPIEKIEILVDGSGNKLLSDGGYTFRYFAPQGQELLNSFTRRGWLLRHFFNQNNISIDSDQNQILLPVEVESEWEIVHKMQAAIKEIVCITTLLPEEAIERECERIVNKGMNEYYRNKL